jgi:hypothetical protein
VWTAWLRPAFSMACIQLIKIWPCFASLSPSMTYGITS